MITKTGIFTGRTFTEGFTNYTGSTENVSEGIYTLQNTGYLQIPFDNNADSFTLYIEVTINDAKQNGYYIGNNNAYGDGFLDTYWNGTGQTDARIRLRNNDGEGLQKNLGATVYQIGINKFKLEYTGTQYIMTRTAANGTVQTYTLDNAEKPYCNYFRLGRSHNTSYDATTIDLTKLAITYPYGTFYIATNNGTISSYQVTSNEFIEL